jgi:predicted MFS family arabinose efflux permease
MTTDPPPPPVWLSLLLATACGLIAANVYYSQPLVGPISLDLGLPRAEAGLIVTVNQIGYVLGLLFLVPIGDLVENRRLVLTLLGLCILALILAAVAREASVFLAASSLIGIGAVGVQVLVPYAAHLSPVAIRGRVVGNVMSGLMLGIMLSRPAASLVTHLFGWHAVFVGSALLMILLAVVLRVALPRRVPEGGMSYGALATSMWELVRTVPVLRRRALYQACLFGAFSVFWTTVPILLAGPAFNLNQAGIAAFGFAGAAGAIAAPIAGRIADRGWTPAASVLAMLAVVCAFLLTHFAPLGARGSLALLVVAAIVLDFGCTANLVLGQRALFVLGGELRSRLNGLYMATFFLGGALGSGVGAWLYSVGGWTFASAFGGALPLVALAYLASGRSGVSPERVAALGR